jgi:hypothetical protein
MLPWRSILTFVVIVGGWAASAGNSCGQMMPPSPPLPYGAPNAEPAAPPPASVNATLPDPGAGGPPPAGWPSPGGAPPIGPPGYTYPPPSFAPASPPLAANAPLLQPAAPLSTPFDKLVQSTWYTRVDYFHWSEHANGADFVTESGALYTLGYQRRNACERFRVELFGGDVRYDGGLQWPDGTTEPSTSSTRYLGCRGEYEYLCEPTWWPEGMFFLGIGSRFWVRDIKSGYGAWGDWGDETQETWWTLYPYLGLEIKRPLQSGMELYSLMRVGATAVTYNYSNAYDLPVYPRLGVVAGLELGLRGQRLSLCGSCEVMTWARSGNQNYYTTDGNGNPMISAVDQPETTMLLLGGRLSYTF